MAVHLGGLVGILDVLDMSFTVFHVVVCVGMGLVGDNSLFAGNMTSTAQVIFRLSVVDEQFTILAVAARLIPCNLDKVPDRSGLVEDVVHLLQRTVGSLRVEEVDDGEDKSVTGEQESTIVHPAHQKTGNYSHNCEDNVGSVSDGAESHRSNHDDHEIEGPVGGGGQSVGGGTDTQRDLHIEN